MTELAALREFALYLAAIFGFGLLWFLVEALRKPRRRCFESNVPAGSVAAPRREEQADLIHKERTAYSGTTRFL